jgi:hypothetical protein
MKTTFLFSAFAAVLLAASSSAGEAPDPAQAARLQALADDAWRLRVKTPQKTYRLVRPTVDVAGITPREPERAPIPWERIQSVETQTHARGRGFVSGAVLGLLASAFVVGIAWDNGEEWGAAQIVIAPIAVGTGGLIGGWIGSSTAANSERVYP